MLVLLGILLLAAYVGWTGLTQGLGGGSRVASERPSASCSTPPPETVRSRGVTVSVYNAGAPEGQATATMEALADQGFQQGALTDAPDAIDVQGIVIWPGDTAPGAVELVKRQFDKVLVVKKHRPLGPGVNVMVGEEFQGLAQNAPRTIEVPQSPVCSSSH